MGVSVHRVIDEAGYIIFIAPSSEDARKGCDSLASIGVKGKFYIDIFPMDIEDVDLNERFLNKVREI